MTVMELEPPVGREPDSGGPRFERVYLANQERWRDYNFLRAAVLLHGRWLEAINMVLSVKTRVGYLSRKDYGDGLDLRTCPYGLKICKQCLGEREAVSFSSQNLALICYIVG